MNEAKFATLALKIWRAKQRVARLQKHGNYFKNVKTYLSHKAALANAKDKLALALLRFQNAVAA